MSVKTKAQLHLEVLAANGKAVPRLWRREQMENLEADQFQYELARLMLRVRKSKGCWLWTGPLDPNGYGQASFYGHLTSAHRAVYMCHRRIKLTSREFVLHHCDVPACCNPDHLYVGGYKENMRDCVNRKRHVSFVHPESFPRGEQSYRAKLKQSDVSKIREMFKNGATGREVSELFPITISGAFKIKHNRAWKQST